MSAKSESILELIDSFFTSLDTAGVEYCHWKSNEHLVEGLAGQTDLDIIVQREQSSEVHEQLGKHDFKLLRSAPLAGYPWVDDYIGMDWTTGQIIHLHLHYGLVLGQKRTKAYRLPWEDVLFARRIKDSETGVYRADPESELLLLLLRYSLKPRLRDLALQNVGSEYLSDEFFREYEWLLARVDETSILELTAELLNDTAKAKVFQLLNSEPTLDRLRELKAAASPVIDDYRTYNEYEALVRGQLREGNLALRELNRRIFDQPRSFRRSIATGGSVIVLLGADGAGKTTVKKRLSEWLGWKTDVTTIYFGSGEGSASFMRKPLKATRSLLDRTRSDNNKEKQSGTKQHSEGEPDWEQDPFPIYFGKILWALTLAREKEKRLKKAVRARNRGIVAISDRYPQTNVMGYNDGPLLYEWLERSSGLRRRLADYELSSYNKANDLSPDLVVKLDVSPGTAVKRKPEMSEQQVERRNEAISRLEFENAKTVTVDADQELDTVLLDIKREIWTEL